MAKSKIAKPKPIRNTTIQKIAKEAIKEQQAAQRAAMKAYRHELAILKRKGLISKAIDVRKVKTRQSNLTRAINQFRDVLEGRAVALKAPKEVIARKKALGARVSHGKVIEPKLPDEKVYINPKGVISHVITTESGKVIRIQPNIEPRYIEEYLQTIAEQESKTKNKRYGFQYFGNNSHATFDSIELALLNLSYYSSLNNAIAKPNPEIQQEYITNLVFFKFERNVDFHAEVPYARSEERLSEYRARQRIRKEKWRANMNDENRRIFLEREKERDREKWRKKLATETPEQREKRLEQKRIKERERRAKIKNK